MEIGKAFEGLVRFGYGGGGRAGIQGRRQWMNKDRIAQHHCVHIKKHEGSYKMNWKGASEYANGGP